MCIRDRVASTHSCGCTSRAAKKSCTNLTAVKSGVRRRTRDVYKRQAMKHIDRDKVVLSTKCGLEWRHESPIKMCIRDSKNTK